MATRGAELPTLGDYQEVYLICRTKHHSWDEIPDDGLRYRDFNGAGTERHLFRCTNCVTKAYEIWVRRTGDLAKPRQYVYPDGYKLSRLKNGNRVLIRDVRKEVMARNKKAKRDILPRRGSLKVA